MGRAGSTLAIALGGAAALGVALGGLGAGASQAGSKAACGLAPAPPDPARPAAGMVWAPGGRFVMGDEAGYPDEGPEREVTVSGFWIDQTEVTNAQFAAFVAATGYLTVAERAPDPASTPGAPPEMLKPGSAVFSPPASLGEPLWWRYLPGASWRSPEGPGSHTRGRENHPVVHVAFDDALAYANWAGRSLPTEAQHEFAARGGAAKARYGWGPTLTVAGQHMANTWQGFFPFENSKADGHAGTAPVGCFPANGYGLYDMIGNVWEWTADWYAPSHEGAGGENPTGPDATKMRDPRQDQYPVRVIKGGSYLCAPNYCARFRPAARHPQDTGLGTSHVGFRTVLNAPGPTDDRGGGP